MEVPEVMVEPVLVSVLPTAELCTVEEPCEKTDWVWALVTVDWMPLSIVPLWSGSAAEE